MRTLAEIESAADALPPEQKQELFLFLATSVLLAAAGSVSGASHALFDNAANQSWVLLGSPYAR